MAKTKAKSVAKNSGHPDFKDGTVDGATIKGSNKDVSGPGNVAPTSGKPDFKDGTVSGIAISGTNKTVKGAAPDTSHAYETIKKAQKSGEGGGDSYF